MLVEVMGEEVRLAVDLTPQTTFEQDLGIESIEMVAFGEHLRNRFGEHVDLNDFIAAMDLDQLIGMTLGQLVEYVAGRLDRSPA